MISSMNSIKFDFKKTPPEFILSEDVKFMIQKLFFE
jgi:hypothetical protein